MNKIVTHKFYKKADFYVSILLMLFGGAILQQELIIEESISKLFPLIVVCMVFICAIGILISTLIGKDMSHYKVLIFTKREIVLICMLLITYFMMTVLGFYTSLGLLLLVSLIYIDGNLKLKTFAVSSVYTVVFMTLIYLTFSLFLKISTPVGLFI